VAAIRAKIPQGWLEAGVDDKCANVLGGWQGIRLERLFG
jgi:hypothetical protein